MPCVKNDDINLYYEVVGKGQPIVFHNGYGGSIPDWYELGYVDALQDDYQLILIDGRGFGKSSKPHDPYQYTYDLQTSDTITVMDHLGIDKAIAFGISMGGRMVYALMKYYPQRFNCFIAAGNHPYNKRNTLGLQFQQWLPHGMSYTVNQIESLFTPFPKNLRERYLANDPKAMLAAFALPQEDFSEALGKITVPVLLYAGSEDPVLPLMQKAVKLLKNGELQLMPYLDHSQAYRHGDLASKLITEFLQRKDLA